jgi:hypothetical protein
MKRKRIIAVAPGAGALQFDVSTEAINDVRARVVSTLI